MIGTRVEAALTLVGAIIRVGSHSDLADPKLLEQLRKVLEALFSRLRTCGLSPDEEQQLLSEMDLFCRLSCGPFLEDLNEILKELVSNADFSAAV